MNILKYWVTDPILGRAQCGGASVVKPISVTLRYKFQCQIVLTYVCNVLCFNVGIFHIFILSAQIIDFFGVTVGAVCSCLACCSGAYWFDSRVSLGVIFVNILCIISIYIKIFSYSSWLLTSITLLTLGTDNLVCMLKTNINLFINI